MFSLEGGGEGGSGRRARGQRPYGAEWINEIKGMWVAGQDTDKHT
jgi:hypothetical protein